MRKHPQTIFGHRLRAAREAAGIPQDQLGVMIGIDEGCSSARISRYETGAHQPPFEIAEKLAAALSVPTAYFYCRSDALSELLLSAAELDAGELDRLKRSAKRIRQSRG
jgi:transcriptional regulator with XRE-family HTH domain